MAIHTYIDIYTVYSRDWYQAVKGSWDSAAREGYAREPKRRQRTRTTTHTTKNCTTVISFFYIMRKPHKPLCPKAFRVLQTKKFTAKKQKICGKNKKNYSEKAKNLQRKTVESVVV